MSKVVRAVYKDGVLKLLEPVELRDGEEVFVRLERYEDPGQEAPEVPGHTR